MRPIKSRTVSSECPIFSWGFPLKTQESRRAREKFAPAARMDRDCMIHLQKAEAEPPQGALAVVLSKARSRDYPSAGALNFNLPRHQQRSRGSARMNQLNQPSIKSFDI